MRAIVVAAGLVLAGCSGNLVHVRLESPVGAQVIVPQGFRTPELTLTTPMTITMESGSMALSGGYPLIFRLDENAARSYGAGHAIDIYARLNLNKPTEWARTQTMRIPISDEKVRALIRGEVGEISAYVEDPNEVTGQQLAVITMRLARF
jgi:hypothetical protein